MIYRGGCHCGNLRFALNSNLPIDALPLRACQCSFCRKHGALSTSDPAGLLDFEIHDDTRVLRYRFGLRTADFLICGACGTYVGATIADDGRQWAIVNANALDDASGLRQAVTPMTYDGEDELARTERRKSRWTPVRLRTPQRSMV